MDEKAAAARRAYMKEYRQRNRDKFREYQERYWTRKAEEMEAAEDDAGDEKGVMD